MPPWQVPWSRAVPPSARCQHMSCPCLSFLRAPNVPADRNTETVHKNVMRQSTMAVSVEQYAERRLNPLWADVVLPVVSVERKDALQECGTRYRVGTCNKCGARGAIRIGCKDALCYPCELGRTRNQVGDRMEVLDRLYAKLNEPGHVPG